jgi:5-methyltetrahydrofolate--homocysteine methyltransferase
MGTLLERLAAATPMIYDGGFGSQLFARGIELANSALANELHPETAIDIHSAYIEAGAEAIGTNTFVASTLHLEMAGVDGVDPDRLVRRAVEHAKAAVEKSGKEVYIAGTIGPSPGAIEADSGDVDFGIPNAVARDAHERVMNALAEGGVDFFCIETMFSATEAAIAVDIARKTGLPIAVCLTYKSTKDRKIGNIVYRTDWGHSAADLLEILSNGKFSNGDNLLDHVHILGINCGAEAQHSEHTGMPYAVNGLKQLREAMDKKGLQNKRLMAYPNAGMPRLDKNHRTYYSQTPEEMALHLPYLLEAGADFIGGCCGTGPSHIGAFREAVLQA